VPACGALVICALDHARTREGGWPVFVR
jgi:hypothetical protein